MKQIKELQRLLGKKKQWKMSYLKKPLSMAGKKVDSARALLPEGWRISLVKSLPQGLTCATVCHGPSVEGLAGSSVQAQA